MGNNKEFDNLIFYCMDVDMKNVMRVYIFPKKLVEKLNSIKITEKNHRFISWYEKYRVNEELYNNVYHKILVDIEKGKDSILRRI